MSVTGDTTSTISGLYKTKFRNFLGQYAPRSNKMLALVNMFGRTEEIGGTSLNTTWPNHKGEGVGSSALTEGGDFPNARPSRSLQFVIGCTHQAFATEWTGHVEAMGDSEDTSWIGDVVQFKMKELKNQVRKMMARWTYHTGSPNLCTATSVTGTTNGSFVPSGCSIHMFEIGQIVTFRDATSGGTEQLTNAATGGGVVVDVDYVNGIVYLADISGGANADVVAWSGYYDATVPNGIRLLVDSTGTVQNINRATVGNIMARAVELDNNGGAMGPSLVDLLRDTVEGISQNRADYKSVWAGNRKMRRWATLSVIGQNRFADLDLSLGVAGIKINDKDGKKTFLEDDLFVDAELYSMCPQEYVFFWPQGMKGGRPRLNGDSIFFTKTGSSAGGTYADATLSFYTLRYNLGCDAFYTQGKATNFVSP